MAKSLSGRANMAVSDRYSLSFTEHPFSLLAFDYNPDDTC